MKDLNFDGGLVSYSLNGKCEISFNPADSMFVERFYNAFDKLGKLQDEYGKKEMPETSAAIFDIAREREGKMRKVIDELFGAPVCEAVFGGMSVCAFADGFPVWLNLMLAVTDEIEANLGAIEMKANPRVEKYTAKYRNYKNVVPMA